MVFGFLVAKTSEGGYVDSTLIGAEIQGSQTFLLTSFTVTLKFKHSLNEASECKYIFPTDSKFCIYETYFVLDGEKIEMNLKEKEEANATYSEAIDQGYTAVIGRSLPNGLSEFVVGNLRPKSICCVVIKLAFTGQLLNERAIFIKFPLEVCTTTSVATSIKNSLKGNFVFTCDVRSDFPIKSVSSNSGGKFKKNVFSLCSIPSDSSLILTTEYVDVLQSTSIVAEDTMYFSIIPHLNQSKTANLDFIFVLDYSGSMEGSRIKKAKDCLNFFLRSLPQGCQFNIVLFGSNYESFFPNNVDYNDKNIDISIEKLNQRTSSLGGTEILQPLLHIFAQPVRPHHASQIFVLSDGEVGNTGDVLSAVSSRRGSYRVFSLGIGSGADAGLINGLADVSGGQSAFVKDNDDFRGIVINLLSSAISSLVTDFHLHIENIDSFEISPFPVPPLYNNSLCSLIAKLPSPYSGQPILCTGFFEDKEIEISTFLVQSQERKVIFSLFSFTLIRDLQFLLNEKRRKNQDVEDLKKKIVELSLQSGILSEFTAFVGVSKVQPFRHHSYNQCYSSDVMHSIGFSDINLCLHRSEQLECMCSVVELNQCSAHFSRRNAAFPSFGDKFKDFCSGTVDFFKNLLPKRTKQAPPPVQSQ